jgi:hypothetical protein
MENNRRTAQQAGHTRLYNYQRFCPEWLSTTLRQCARVGDEHPEPAVGGGLSRFRPATNEMGTSTKTTTQAIAAIMQSIVAWSIQRGDSSFMLLGWRKNAPHTFQPKPALIVPEINTPARPRCARPKTQSTPRRAASRALNLSTRSLMKPLARNGPRVVRATL